MRSTFREAPEKRRLRPLLLLVSLFAVAGIAVPSTAGAASETDKERALDSARINAAGDLCVDIPILGRRCVPLPNIPPNVLSASSISGFAREGNTITGTDAVFRALSWDVPFPLTIVLPDRIGLSERIVDRFWKRDGARVANGSNYQIRADDVGKQNRYVTVGEAFAQIGPVTATFGRTTSESSPVVPSALPLTAISAPTISGLAREGSILSCAGGGWSPAPSSRQLAWLRNGSVVGSGGSYVAKTADVGKQLACRESVSRLGESGAATSRPVTVTAKPLRLLVRPRVIGVAKVGRTLTCGAGVWSPAPTLRSYSWRRGSVVVGSGRTYVAKRADGGRSLTCRESVRRLGVSAVATSLPRSISR